MGRAAALVVAASLALSAPAAAVPPTEEEFAAIAHVHVPALIAFFERDADALLAVADRSFVAWLEQERALALGLPAERLLASAPRLSALCVPPVSAVRILSLRQMFPAARLAALTTSELLATGLAADPSLPHRYAPDRRLAAFTDPVAYLRDGDDDLDIVGDRAYLLLDAHVIGLYHRVSVAIRQADGSWRADPLWLYGMFTERVVIFSNGFAGIEPPWSADAYLAALGTRLKRNAKTPGLALSEERLWALAQPPRRDDSLACLPSVEVPPYALCWSENGEVPCGY